ncbi:hypothetical protein DV737_g3065, partial [Chaetothyriales sp. CBS 132003]
MKFLLSVALASACFISNASGDAGEAYKVADDALNTIMARTENMTNAIKAWDGTDLQAALYNIHVPSASTTKYVVDTAELLQQYSATFDNTQAFKIGSPSQRLAYAVNASIANLVRRKDDFDTAHVSEAVIQDLTALLSASRNFSDALSRLLPEKLQVVADNMKAQNLDSLQQGIDCFNGTSSACYTVIINPNRTYELAVRYNAMKADGAPFV